MAALNRIQLLINASKVNQMTVAGLSRRRMHFTPAQKCPEVLHILFIFAYKNSKAALLAAVAVTFLQASLIEVTTCGAPSQFSTLVRVVELHATYLSIASANKQYTFCWVQRYKVNFAIDFEAAKPSLHVRCERVNVGILSSEKYDGVAVNSINGL